MTEYNKGDLVEVTVRAKVEEVDPHGLVRLGDYWFDYEAEDEDDYRLTVKLIERADDPAKDPVGTVRGFTASDGPFIKVRRDEWRLMKNTDDESIPWSDRDIADLRAPKTVLCHVGTAGVSVG